MPFPDYANAQEGRPIVRFVLGALVGGAAALGLLWPVGLFFALAALPFGGALLGLLMVLTLQHWGPGTIRSIVFRRALAVSGNINGRI
jgi:hypothetical protein